MSMVKDVPRLILQMLSEVYAIVSECLHYLTQTEWLRKIAN